MVADDVTQLKSCLKVQGPALHISFRNSDSLCNESTLCFPLTLNASDTEEAAQNRAPR